jgi:hypothetical protein
MQDCNTQDESDSDCCIVKNKNTPHHKEDTIDVNCRNTHIITPVLKTLDNHSNGDCDSSTTCDVIPMQPRRRLSLRKLRKTEHINKTGQRSIVIPALTYMDQNTVQSFTAMMNIGNTCWLNSTLQAFAKSKVVRDIEDNAQLNDCESNLLHILNLLRSGTSSPSILCRLLHNLFYYDDGNQKWPT